jgi:outer membrane protein
VRSAKAAERRSLHDVRNVEQAIVERTSSLYSQLDSARRGVQASQRQIEAANIAYEGVEIEQQVGTRSALDVLNAEQEVLNAKLALAQSQRNVDILTVQLLNIVGAFDALSLSLPVDIYDPKDNFKTVTTIGILDPFRDKIKGTPLETVLEPVELIAKEVTSIPEALGRKGAK